MKTFKEILNETTKKKYEVYYIKNNENEGSDSKKIFTDEREIHNLAKKHRIFKIIDKSNKKEVDPMSYNVDGWYVFLKKDNEHPVLGPFKSFAIANNSHDGPPKYNKAEYFG